MEGRGGGSRGRRHPRRNTAPGLVDPALFVRPASAVSGQRKTGQINEEGEGEGVG